MRFLGCTRGFAGFGRRILGAWPSLGVRPGVIPADETLIATISECVGEVEYELSQSWMK